MSTRPSHPADAAPAAPAGLVRSWVSFWFAPRDPLGLHALRVLTGLVLLGWLLPFAGHQEALFGLDGWFDLQAYQEKSATQKSGRLEKFSLTATQAILYFDSFAPGDTVTIRFRLRAKYPIRARTFQSRVYEYYDPEVSSVARPVQLEVRGR